jgi:hypothetical protein
MNATETQPSGREGENEIELKSEATAPMPRPSTLIELFQVSHFRSHSTHLTIFDGRFLSVHTKKPLHKSERYWLDLAYLDPTPHLLALVDNRSLYVAVALSAVTLILLLASAVAPHPWYTQAWASVMILMLASSIIAFFVFFQRSRNLVRFHSRSGDVVLLEMFSHMPSRGEFREFMRALIQHIQAAHKAEGAKPHQRLGAELCEHRRLKDAGVLTQDAYDQAREKILRRYRQANIRPRAKKRLAADAPPADTRHPMVEEITVANGKWQSRPASLELFEEAEKSDRMARYRR